MHIVGTLFLVGLLVVARSIGEHYGWHYHAFLLAGLGGVLAVLFRAATPKPPEPMQTLPMPNDPERRLLLEQIQAIHENLVQSYPALRRDMMLLPILACAPAVVILCVLQQRSYLPAHTIWFRLSFVPFLVYFVVRFFFPKKSRRTTDSDPAATAQRP